MNYPLNGGIVLGAISTVLRPNDPNFPADVLQRRRDRVSDKIILSPGRWISLMSYALGGEL